MRHYLGCGTNDHKQIDNMLCSLGHLKPAVIDRYTEA